MSCGRNEAINCVASVSVTLVSVASVSVVSVSHDLVMCQLN